MSRGGGGRGGRGGGRGGAGGGGNKLPWESGEVPDSRPSELFPSYDPTAPHGVVAREKGAVAALLRYRSLARDGPLYTARRVRNLGGAEGGGGKAYGQAQVNALYGVHSKASVDPFTAVETWERRNTVEKRALPDIGRMRFCKSSFPSELHSIIDPTSSRGKTAAAASTAWSGNYGDGNLTADDAKLIRNHKELLERLTVGHEDEVPGPGLEDEEGQEEIDVDEEYDDEDAGDYDAENYFDDGGDMGDDDYGGDDDGTF